MCAGIPRERTGPAHAGVGPRGAASTRRSATYDLTDFSCCRGVVGILLRAEARQHASVEAQLSVAHSELYWHGSRTAAALLSERVARLLHRDGGGTSGTLVEPRAALELLLALAQHGADAGAGRAGPAAVLHRESAGLCETLSSTRAAGLGDLAVQRLLSPAGCADACGFLAPSQRLPSYIGACELPRLCAAGTSQGPLKGADGEAPPSQERRRPPPTVPPPLEPPRAPAASPAPPVVAPTASATGPPQHGVLARLQFALQGIHAPSALAPDRAVQPSAVDDVTALLHQAGERATCLARHVEELVTPRGAYCGGAASARPAPTARAFGAALQLRLRYHGECVAALDDAISLRQHQRALADGSDAREGTEATLLAAWVHARALVIEQAYLSSLCDRLPTNTARHAPETPSARTPVPGGIALLDALYDEIDSAHGASTLSGLREVLWRLFVAAAEPFLAWLSRAIFAADDADPCGEFTTRADAPSEGVRYQLPAFAKVLACDLGVISANCACDVSAHSACDVSAHSSRDLGALAKVIDVPVRECVACLRLLRGEAAKAMLGRADDAAPRVALMAASAEGLLRARQRWESQLRCCTMRRTSARRPIGAPRSSSAARCCARAMRS